MRFRLPGLLPLAAALLLPACSGERPVFVQQIYVDALLPGADDESGVVLRYLAEDGSPTAAPAPLQALTPVVNGVPIGRFTDEAPVRGAGVRVAFVVDPELNPALFEPQRQLYLQLAGELSGKDVGALFTATPAAAEAPSVSFVDGPALVTALRAMQPISATELGPRPLRPAGGGPMAWVQGPTEVIDRAIASLGASDEGVVRRALVVVLEGRQVGRSWNQVSRWAAAAGVDLHLITVPPEGRLAAEGKIERPLFHYAATDVGMLPQIGDGLRDAVFGGHLLTFQTERRGVGLVRGFAVRARQPRGGWEEFALAELTTPPAHLAIDRLSSLGGGRWRATLRALDARGESLALQPEDVELLLGDQPAPPDPGPGPEPEPVLLGVLALPVGDDEEAKAQRAAVEGALIELGPTDRVSIAAGGVVPFGEHPAIADRTALAAAAAALVRPPQQPARDLESDVIDLVRQLQANGAAKERRSALLILSGLREVRNVRGTGQGTYRFQVLLQYLRRMNVTPLWVARVPLGEYEAVRTQVRRMAGGNLWTVAGWPELSRAAGQAVRAFRQPLVLTFKGPDSEEQVRAALQAHFVHRGRPIDSRPGISLPAEN